MGACRRGGARSGPHTALVATVVRLLQLHRIVHWKQNTGAMEVGGRFVRFGEAGLPDILAIAPGGRLCGLEVKTGAGRLTPDQESWRDRFRAAGALYVEVRELADAAEALGLPSIRRAGR